MSQNEVELKKQDFSAELRSPSTHFLSLNRFPFCVSKSLLLVILLHVFNVFIFPFT